MWGRILSIFLKNKKKTTIAVCLLVPFIVSLLLFSGFMNTWEAKISDAFYTTDSPLDEIVIIAIDDASLQKLGRWPWPRKYISQVIEQVNQSAVIGIDISFFESSADDEVLAQSIKKNDCVLAMEYTNFSVENNHVVGGSFLQPSSTLGLTDVDYCMGYVNLFTDSDGVTRSFAPSIQGIENHVHFSMMVSEQYTGIAPQIDHSKMLINFFSKPGGYTTIPFSDVYDNKINPSFFQNKIVLIGATASDLHDDAIVPISNQAMSGVEINANIVQSIILQDFIFYQDAASTIFLIFLFAIIVGVLLLRFRIHIAIVLIALVAFGYLILSIRIFDMGIIMNIIFPLFSMTSVSFILLSNFYINEERNRKWITSVFGKYVSPMVIDTLIKNPQLINLGGEKRKITIFFSDIREFTSISEKIRPEELVNLLNEYLTEMSAIIIKNQGLVDKYMGDAIMAFWNAPVNQRDHAEIACMSSLEMIDKLAQLQQKWHTRGIPSFSIGIGINSGEAIVGNMGSEKRFDYTAMGDSVNLASRLEGLNKIYGTQIIISQMTFMAVKDMFLCRKLDAVKVKGREESIFIYELCSKVSEATEKEKEFISIFETGLNHYFEKQWEKAVMCFQRAAEINKDDKATQLFILRCETFRHEPPPYGWNGVWEMKTK